MSTKATPLSAGMAAKNFLKASSPPAEAPMPATGGPGRPALLSPRSTTAAAVGGDSSVWSRVWIGCGTAFVSSEAAEGFAFFFFAAIAAPLDSLTGWPPKASGLGSHTQYIRPARHRAACRGFPHYY